MAEWVRGWVGGCVAGGAAVPVCVCRRALCCVAAAHHLQCPGPCPSEAPFPPNPLSKTICTLRSTTSICRPSEGGSEEEDGQSDEDEEWQSGEEEEDDEGDDEEGGSVGGEDEEGDGGSHGGDDHEDDAGMDG